MAVGEGGSNNSDCSTGYLTALELRSTEKQISTKSQINLNLLVRGYVWITKFLSNLARLKK